MDKKDTDRLNKQLARTLNAIFELNEANIVAGNAIRKLEYELKLMEQKVYEMEKSWKELDV